MELTRDHPLAALSTIGIGGPARYLLEVRSAEQMAEALQWCTQESVTWFVLGKGSNSLFDDRGFDGLVLVNRIDGIEEKEGRFVVGAGVSFAWLGQQTAKQGWKGLEFAAGIPASVGGAVYMNAGAQGGETAQPLVGVDVIEGGKLRHAAREELAFAYRSSPFQGRDSVIVAAHFQLQRDEGARERQRLLLDHRIKTQPYSDKSAGCAFKNPPGHAAGALIEQCGLKGMSVGDACISLRHANFVINRGKATAQDVRQLMQQVQARVHEQFGVHLEQEIREVPFAR